MRVVTRTIILLLPLVLCAQNVVAQDQPEKETAAAESVVREVTAPLVKTLPSIEDLQQKLKTIAGSTDLDDAGKSQQSQIITRTIEELSNAEGFKTRLESLNAAKADAPALLEQWRKKLAAVPDEVKTPDSQIDLVTAQQKLADQESKLTILEKTLASIETELTRRTNRRSAIPRRLGEVRADLEALALSTRTADAEVTVSGDDATLLLARQLSLKAESALLDQEIPSYNATDPVLQAERDLVARDVIRAKKRVEFWREFVTEKRRTESERHAREANQRVDRVHAEVKPIAINVADLAKSLVSERRALAAKIRSTEEATAQVEIERTRLKREFDELTVRAQLAGFTNSVGLLLRKQRSSLPNLESLNLRISARQEEIGATHINRIGYQHDRPMADELEHQIEQFMAKQQGLSEFESEQREIDIRDTLMGRSEYLDGIIGDLSSLIDRLARLDSEERALLRQTKEQSTYIAEHILWVRGTTPVTMTTVTDTWTAWKWVTRSVGSALSQLWSDAKQMSIAWIAFVIFLIAGSVYWIRAKRLLIALGQTAARRRTTSMKPTIQAAGLTFALSLAGPAVLYFLSWRLSVISPDGRSEVAVASALKATGGLWFLFDVLRRLCRPSGLARAHFAWPDKSTDSLRGMTRTVMLFCVPLAFLVVVTERSGNDVYHASLGRLALVAALLGFAWRQYRILRRSGRIMTELVAQHPDSWLARLRLVYPFTALLPLTLAGLALSGYLFAARQLSTRFVHSLWLFAGVLLCISLLRRWQLLTYRALAMKQARERRAALQSEAEEQGLTAEVDAASAAFEEEAVVLSDSNQQTSKLIGLVFGGLGLVGIALLWSDVLPALSSLYEIKFWPNSLADANATELERWIKLSDVALAFLIATVTVAAARNVPGVLEFAVLQRLPLDSGSRYAVSSVFRYTIMVIGIIIAFRFLGVGWSNVQWLVAAMTVGLGFGLQEVFANFVSGLILLFERPIRVGDTVTVGDVIGTVTRIRIRATTIVDWDRKELVVPNREFVTGQLINWTLTDPTLRVTVKVGIAYGSDTRLATKLLYQVAEENEDVLQDPAPVVIFHAFGDSTLDFELRFFVNSPIKFTVIRHSVNLAIDDLFREHNVEIAFPQQDLHLRSSDMAIVAPNPSMSPLT